MARLPSPVALALAAVIGGCAAGDPEDRPAPPAPPPLAEARLTIPDLKLAIVAVERIGESVIEIQFAVTNTAAAGAPVVVTNQFATSPADAGTIADVTLVDGEGRWKTFVIRGADRRPACSTAIEPLPPGATRALWARFLAPPRGTTRIGVRVPGVASVLTVPLPQPDR